MPNEYPIYTTFRTVCKRGRVAYRPDWSESMPWVSYVNGTAGLHFVSLEKAATYFSTRWNMTLVTEEPSSLILPHLFGVEMKPKLKLVREQAWDLYLELHEQAREENGYAPQAYANWEEVPSYVKDRYFRLTAGSVTGLYDDTMRRTIFGIVPTLDMLFDDYGYSKSVRVPHGDRYRFTTPRPPGFYFCSSRHPRIGTWLNSSMDGSLSVKPNEQVVAEVRQRCCEGAFQSFEIIPWVHAGVALVLATDTQMIANPWVAMVPLEGLPLINAETTKVLTP